VKIFKIAQIYDMDSAYESLNEQYYSILSEYHKVKDKKKKNTPHMSWKVIPFARLKKIWEDYAKTGVVRDVNGMEEIKQNMLSILTRLQAATDLSGHGTLSAEDIEDSTGLKMPNGKDTDFYFNFLETDYGTPISDYGLDKLWALAKILLNSTSPEKQLLICDQMLNIVHQRGDLAALFVEGGSSSLSQLAEGHLQNNPPDPEAVKNWKLYR
jgi:hypothetical protein